MLKGLEIENVFFAAGRGLPALLQKKEQVICLINLVGSVSSPLVAPKKPFDEKEFPCIL
jgi:hypothetical protein